MKQYLEIGKIVNVHGLRGDVKVVPWCDEPEFLCEFDTLYLGKAQKPVSVTAARLQKGNVLLHLEGVDTVEAAEQLRQADLNTLTPIEAMIWTATRWNWKKACTSFRI